MLRKVKAHSRRNSTSSDQQYLEEQRRIDAKVAQRNKIGELRRVCLFGSSGERTSLHMQVKQDADFQLHMRTQMKGDELRQKRLEEDRMERHRSAMAEQEAERARMRKEQLRQIQEANRIAAEAKFAHRLHSKVVEDSYDRRLAEERTLQFNPNVF